MGCFFRSHEGGRKSLYEFRKVQGNTMRKRLTALLLSFVMLPVTVSAEEAGGSLTVPKALYQQEYLLKDSTTITGTAASYILPGTTKLYEYAPTKDSVILRDRYSYRNEKEYRAVFGNAFNQVRNLLDSAGQKRKPQGFRA